MSTLDQSIEQEHTDVEAEAERLVGPFDSSEIVYNAYEYPAGGSGN
ncbi:hypothetical protein IRJ34_07260 [Paenarthrobacter sp. GOM3]|nr:hypothetical protein [Paenarthrobacter sp. GOM3]WOH20114.1 hypothetical protein IRJ34_07260 [Paenarthrobacter sp. GOM3]